MENIVVILEQRNGNVKKSSFEAVSAAVELGKTVNAPVTGIVCGNTLENLAQSGKYGLSKVIHLKANEFEQYTVSGYKHALLQELNGLQASTILIANTAFGKDLAPRLAVQLKAGLIMDCIEVGFSGSQLSAVRPIFAGKAKELVKTNTAVKIVTLRPNVFKAIEENCSANIEVKEITAPVLTSRTIAFNKAGEKLDVAEADIIVSGGRGMKGPENFNLIENLAAELQAAVGASRAVVDAGWRPHSEQVGQTGKTVSPSLYIACGISGAIQHLAGMSSSKYIVAINKDKDAPIFSVADYGINGDVFEILPELIEEIKKLKN